MTRTAMALLAMAIAFPAAAQETNDARYRQLGECMAYFAVSGGLDGKKEVDPAMAATIRTFASEFMFEASALGYDDNAAHTFVVERLAEQNLLVTQQGTQALEASHGDMCKALGSHVLSGKDPGH